MATKSTDLPNLPLPPGINSDYVDCASSCGLKFHVLKAGQPGKPLILFCHGFPELAFSWRHILPSIANEGEGYHCVAVDQRGYGRTTGWEQTGRPYDKVDLSQYTFTNLVRDLVCLVYGLGYTSVHCIVGHDFGAVSSAMAALMRPDIFRSSVQMSHPHHAPPSPPLGSSTPQTPRDIQAELARLDPPRKHYKYYNSGPTAAHDWENAPQGLAAYLRGYFHLKSGAWPPNANPHPLSSWTADLLAGMPEYYIMPHSLTFPETIAKHMSDPSEEANATATTDIWLPSSALSVYVNEWSRTGFQGALNWYRAQTASTEASRKDLLLFAGAKITVPCAFISGQRDWGNFQQPGALEGYEDGSAVMEGCFRGTRFVEGAGHWVQQERPTEVVKELLWFLGTLERDGD